MKRFLLYISSVFVIVFGGIAIVNYVVDPGHIYGDKYEKFIVKGFENGMNVTNIGNFEDRIVKRRLVELNTGKDFDILVLGSSRVLQINSDIISDKKTILNLGVTGGQIEDFLSFYQICKENRVKYKTAIIGLELTLFNRKYGHNTLWESNDEYYYRFKGQNEKRPTKLGKELANLCSASYFKSAISSFLFDHVKPLLYTDSRYNDEMTICVDGSRIYGKQFYNRKQALIDQEAITWNHSSYSNYTEIDGELISDFELLLDSLDNDGVKIVFYCCPYHPLFYNRIITLGQNYNALEIIYSVARKRDIKVIGQFSPKDYVDNSCFLDASHPSYNLVRQILNEM